MTTKFAAVDLGSNGTRMYVAARDAAGVVTDLHRDVVVTKLGSLAGADGSLHPDSEQRTLECLRAYRSVLDEYGVTVDAQHVAMVATSAVRDAPNRAEFLNACSEIVGVPVRLLTGEQEGTLSFAGATAGLSPGRSPYGEDELNMIIDIGGGSTEFVVGLAGQPPMGAVSIDAGCVRFGERFLSEFDPPGPEALSGAISVVQAHLDDVDRELPLAGQARRLLGLGGSISTVAAVEIGLHTYDRSRVHHFELTRAAAEDVFRTLATERRSDRAHNPGLPAGRVDTIVAGALILVAIMRHYKFDSLLVSENDILDGLVTDLIAAVPL